MTKIDPSDEREQRHRARILRFLAAGSARVEEAAAPALLLLDGDQRGKISIPVHLLDELLGNGLVTRTLGSGLVKSKPEDNGSGDAYC